MSTWKAELAKLLGSVPRWIVTENASKEEGIKLLCVLGRDCLFCFWIEQAYAFLGR